MTAKSIIREFADKYQWREFLGIQKKDKGVPGEVILNLTEEQRDALKALKSDDLQAELLYGLLGTKVLVRKRSKTLIEKMSERFGKFKRH